jgi:hypothetical protein
MPKRSFAAKDYIVNIPLASRLPVPRVLCKSAILLDEPIGDFQAIG